MNGYVIYDARKVFAGRIPIRFQLPQVQLPQVQLPQVQLPQVQIPPVQQVDPTPNCSNVCRIRD